MSWRYPLITLIGISPVALTLFLSWEERSVRGQRLLDLGFALKPQAEIPNALEGFGVFSKTQVYAKKGNGFTVFCLHGVPSSKDLPILSRLTPLLSRQPFLAVVFDRTHGHPRGICVLPSPRTSQEEKAMRQLTLDRLGSVRYAQPISTPFQDRLQVWGRNILWDPCVPPDSFWVEACKARGLSIEFMESGLRIDQAPLLAPTHRHLLDEDTIGGVERMAHALMESQGQPNA